MVRKIKKYNRQKIRVQKDGRMYTMYFKTVMKEIKKSYKAYFAEDGHVILESKPYSDAGTIDQTDTDNGIEQESQGNSDSSSVSEHAVGELKREPVQVENDK